MIHDIVRMGEPVLLRVADPVEGFGSGELRDLAADMFETMDLASGVGLAAPQIALSRRVIVFGFEASERYPDAPPVPRTALFNPSIEALSDELEDGWEGCLSIPGLRAVIPRFRRIRYSGWDVEGRRLERVAEGFHARVVQHEVDHLDGILYPSRIRDFSTFGFTDVLFPEIDEGK
jgi:peptide deformylase